MGGWVQKVQVLHDADEDHCWDLHRRQQAGEDILCGHLVDVGVSCDAAHEPAEHAEDREVCRGHGGLEHLAVLGGGAGVQRLVRL